MLKCANESILDILCQLNHSNKSSLQVDRLISIAAVAKPLHMGSHEWCEEQ